MSARRLASLVIGSLLLLACAFFVATLLLRQDDGTPSLARVGESGAVDPGLHRPDARLKAPTKRVEPDPRRAVVPTDGQDAAVNGLQLRIEVVNSAGAPVTDYMISIDRLYEGRSLAVLSWTELSTRGGRSEHAIPPCDGWEEAIVEVRITSDEHHTMVLELTELELKSGAVHRIVLQPTHVIDGRVVQEDGDPVDNADVFVFNREGEPLGSASTDHTGAFHIESEFPGVLEHARSLKVSARGFVPYRIERTRAHVAWRELRIVMDDGNRIAGRVLFSGECQDLTVRWRVLPGPDAVEKSDSRWSRKVHVDSDGSFVLDHLPDARVSLLAECERERSALSAATVVDARDAAVYGVQIDLQNMHELRGSVSFAGYKGEQGVMVRAVGDVGGPNESRSTWMGTNGSELVLECAQPPGSEVALRAYLTFEFYVERTVIVGPGDSTDFGAIVISQEELEAAEPR